MGVPAVILTMAGGNSGNNGLTMQPRFGGVAHMIRLGLQSFHKLYPLAVELSQPALVGGGTRVRVVYAAASLRQPRVSRKEQVEPLPPLSLVTPWDPRDTIAQ